MKKHLHKLPSTHKSKVSYPFLSKSSNASQEFVDLFPLVWMEVECVSFWLYAWTSRKRRMIWCVYNEDLFLPCLRETTGCFPASTYDHDVFISPADFCIVANTVNLMEHCSTKPICWRTNGSNFWSILIIEISALQWA